MTAGCRIHQHHGSRDGNLRLDARTDARDKNETADCKQFNEFALSTKPVAGLLLGAISFTSQRGAECERETQRPSKSGLWSWKKYISACGCFTWHSFKLYESSDVSGEESHKDGKTANIDSASLVWSAPKRNKRQKFASSFRRR